MIASVGHGWKRFEWIEFLIIGMVLIVQREIDVFIEVRFHYCRRVFGMSMFGLPIVRNGFDSIGQVILWFSSISVGIISFPLNSIKPLVYSIGSNNFIIINNEIYVVFLLFHIRFVYYLLEFSFVEFKSFSFNPGVNISLLDFGEVKFVVALFFINIFDSIASIKKWFELFLYSEFPFKPYSIANLELYFWISFLSWLKCLTVTR